MTSRSRKIKKRKTVQGRPRQYEPGVDRGQVWAQVQIARRLGWPFSVDADRVRFKPPKGFAEADAVSLSQTELGVLRAKGHISADMYLAGQAYQSAIWRAYGKPFARVVDLNAVRGGSEGDDPHKAMAFARLADGHVADAVGVRAMLGMKQLLQYDRPVDAVSPMLINALKALTYFVARGPR